MDTYVAHREKVVLFGWLARGFFSPGNGKRGYKIA